MLVEQIPPQTIIEWSFCRRLIMVDELRTYFDWIRFLCRLWTSSIAKILKNVLSSIMSGPHHWCYSFLKFHILVGHHKIQELFHFLRLASKKPFHSLSNRLPVNVSFATLFIETFRMWPIFFTITICFPEMVICIDLVCLYYDKAIGTVSRRTYFEIFSTWQFLIASCLQNVM